MSNLPPFLLSPEEDAPPGDWPVVTTRPTQGCFLSHVNGVLELRDAERPDARGVCASFSSDGIGRRLQSGRQSPLARALGLHRRPSQTVFDATCGLGRDSAVLLGLGCRLFAAERNPVLQQLLLDALNRFEPQPDHWLGLHCCEAEQVLRMSDRPSPDIIYIDPMFHAPGRKALPKLEMQLLRQVVGDDADVPALIALARRSGASRVVVKSHPRSRPIGTPDFSQASGRMRFDVYLSAVKPVR